MSNYFGVNLEFDKNKIDSIVDTCISNNAVGYVCSVDGNNFSIAVKDSNHKQLLNTAIVNICDSSWIAVMVNKIYHTDYKEYHGPDLFIDYIKKKKYKQFFLGSNSNILTALKDNLSKIDPSIKNMVFMELPFRKVEEFDYTSIAKIINDNSPDLVWVSLGCPKQERFMQLLQPYLDRGIMFGIGAAFNFYSGLENAPKRAPQWMIDNKLECVYRIFSEPKKQIKRCWRFIKIIPQVYLKEQHQYNLISSAK